MVGLICVGFLASDEYVDGDKDMAGIFYGGNGKQLGYQLYGLVVYFAWSFTLCYGLFYGLNSLGWLRVSEEVEQMGMDEYEHGGAAYSMLSSQLRLKIDKLAEESDKASAGEDKVGAENERDDTEAQAPEQALPKMLSRPILKGQGKSTALHEGAW